MNFVVEIINGYEFFNGYEMGQFWRLIPSKSYVVKDNVCKFGKQSKERITIFVCGSMMEEKLKLTVIGKSETFFLILLIK